MEDKNKQMLKLIDEKGNTDKLELKEIIDLGMRKLNIRSNFDNNCSHSK